MFFIFNTSSLVFSILSTLLVGLLFGYSSNLCQRSSLRFQAILGLIDASRHFHTLLSAGVKDVGVKCSLLGFYRLFCAHLYTFFTASMAFQIDYAYVLEKKMKRNVLTWFVPFLVVLLVDLMPLFIGSHKTSANEACNVEESYVSKGSYYFFLKGIIQAPLILYQVLVLGMIFTKTFAPPSNEYMLDTFINNTRLAQLAAQI